MSIHVLIKYEIASLHQEISCFAFLFATAVMTIVVGPFPSIPMIQVPFLLIGWFLCFRRKHQWDYAMLLLLIYIPIGILISSPDPVFRPWERYSLFLILLLFVSPLVRNQYAIMLRRQVLFSFLIYSVLIGLGSFLCYFMGVNYMQSVTGELITDVHSVGGFGGLTKHSMILAPISGFGALYLLYRTVSTHLPKILYWIGVFVCMITILFSASRSALMATIAGFIVILYYSKKDKGKFIKYLTGLVLAAVLSFPLWEGAAKGIVSKQESNKEIGQYGSRTTKWTARVEEFKSSPFFGVGFASQNPKGEDSFDKESGTIEPGSSWLAILSMNGIIGFLLFVNIIMRPIIYLRKQSEPYSALLLGLLAMLMVHMLTEGYIYAGGSALCIIAWVIIGCARDASFCCNKTNSTI